MNQTTNQGYNLVENTDEIQTSLNAWNGNFNKIDADVTRLQTNIKVIEDNFDTDTTPNSNNFILEDSASGYIPRDDEGNPFDIKIGDGPVLEQETTEGKNKYNINDLTSFHCTFEVSGQSVTVTDTQTYAYIEQKIDNLDTTKLYRISFDGDAASWITVLDSSKTKTNESYGSKALGFTPTTSTIYIRLYATTSGTSATKTWSNIQLEEGSTATSYEEYTGGQASPNPSYPQTVNVVEGECGIDESTENLFDKNSATTQVGYFRDTGEIASGGDSTITTSYTRIVPNVDYTISGFIFQSMCFYDANYNFIKRVIGINSSSYTFNENAYYIRIQGQTINFNLDVLKLEQGLIANPYVPHKGKSFDLTLPEGMFLGSIGEASNYIYGTKDNWKLHQGLIKAVLSSESNWTKSSNTAVDRFVWSGFRSITGIVLPQLCNYLKKSAPGVITPGAFKINDAQLLIDFTEYGTTTLEQFREWLSSHEVYVYGELTTPTETDITDTTLITQLNNIIDNLQTYKGGTVVFTTSENLEPNVQFDYLQNPLSSIEARLDLLEA